MPKYSFKIDIEHNRRSYPYFGALWGDSEEPDYVVLFHSKDSGCCIFGPTDLLGKHSNEWDEGLFEPLRSGDKFQIVID